MSMKSQLANILLGSAILGAFESVNQSRRPISGRSKGITMPPKKYAQRKARMKMQKQSRKTNR